MNKLTKRNYFTIKNKHISNSKMSDWEKDKNYFYHKHVIGDIIRDITDPMIMGSAVDNWIMDGEKKFRDKYCLVSRRSKGEDNYEYQLNKTMFDKVEKMARQITLQDAYKKLRGFKKQTILQIDMDLGLFAGLCGIPDWFKIIGDKAIIVDLKTTDDADPRSYYFKCLNYGYFRQAALYAMLIHNIYNIAYENIECRHLAVEKDRDEIYKCKTFILAQQAIMDELENIMDILHEIKSETKFAAHDATWDNAVVI